ncbi:MAG: divalent-cation tolerance protein CutA [Caldisericaceae bacterium]|nr:divalent-cation tolerance protein CutA [Caldisericaceae bacterium]
MVGMEIVVFCTTPDQKTAEQIAQTVVEEKLAACCNLISNLTSIYFWQGKIQKDSEVLLIIKTDKKLFSKLEVKIKEMHPYEVPEIISMAIEQGNKAYLNWIHEVLGV